MDVGVEGRDWSRSRPQSATRRASPARLAQLARIVLVLVALWLFTRAVQRVAWAQVWHSVRDLSAWQAATLLAVLSVRQVLNAAPLALFVPGLGLRRALANDLSANLTATSPLPRLMSCWGC